MSLGRSGDNSTSQLAIVPDHGIQQSLPNEVPNDNLESALEKLLEEHDQAQKTAATEIAVAATAATAVAAAVADIGLPPPPAPPGPPPAPRPAPQQLVSKAVANQELPVTSPNGRSFASQRTEEIRDNNDNGTTSTESLIDAKRQLEELQIQTIFSLVEPATVNEQSVKLLVLTNKQALTLNIDPLEKFMQAMDLNPRPKFVINFALLSPSHMPAGPRDAAHVLDRGEGYCAYGLPCYISEPESFHGLNQSQRKVVEFLRECILPVAIQTNALIILGDSRCEFSRGFAFLCETEAAAAGGKLPFSVLSIGSAENFHRSSQKAMVRGRRTTSYQLLQASKRWKSLTKDILAAMINDRGPWECDWSPETLDAVPGCTHYIIVDSVSVCDNGSKNVDPSPLSTLTSNLIYQFSSELPSIAICSFGMFGWGIRRMTFLSEFVGRGLPLLFLDSRPKDVIKGHCIEEAVRGLLELESRLEDQGMVNFYYASAVASIHAAMKRELSQSEDPHMAMAVGTSDLFTAASSASVVAKTNGQHRGLVYDVIANLREKRQAVDDLDCADKSQLGQQDKQVRAAAIRAVHGLIQVWEATIRGFHNRMMPHQMDTYLNALLTEVHESNDFVEMNAVLQKHSVAWCGLGLDGPPATWCDTAIKLYPDFFEVRRQESWGLLLAIREDVSSISEVRAAFGQLTQEYWRRGRHHCLGLDDPDQPMSSQLYDNCIVVMRSPCTYSNNLEDLEKVSNTITKIARIDHLPQENTYEAMFVVRGAWEKVDIYSHVCLKCKQIAKVIYLLAILLTVFTTTVTAVSLNEPDVISKDSLDYIVMIGTLAGSVLVAVTTFINPFTKWQQLRGAALALESEIWMYRTRCGQYAIKGGRVFFSRGPDLKLQQITNELASSVLKASTVMDTAFLSQFDGLFEEPKNKFKYRHGQYPGCRSDGTFGQALNDDHHSPITAAKYLQLRIKPQLEFYQSRLPKYARTRALSQMVLVASSVAGSVLAFLKASEWAVISSSVSAAATAWVSFSNADKKLLRFSSVIAGIDSTLLWWNSLTDVEQASPPKIDTLVLSCEQLFQGERDAWVTTAINTALLNNDKDEKSENRAESIGSPQSASNA